MEKLLKKFKKCAISDFLLQTSRNIYYKHLDFSKKLVLEYLQPVDKSYLKTDSTWSCFLLVDIWPKEKRR